MDKSWNNRGQRGIIKGVEYNQSMKDPSNQTPKPDRPLTRKQTAFVQHLINNPKASAAAAARATYGKPDKDITDGSARQIATDNLANPSIRSELAKYEGTAENTLIEVMNTSKEFSKLGNTAGASYAGTAGQIANSIIDRIRGKATQRIEQHSTTVTLSLSLDDITGVNPKK